MNNSLKLMLLAAFVVSVAACSSAKKRVMPGADGNHKVVATDYKKEDSAEAAVDAANDFCEDRGKTAAFTSEKQKYQGKYDEKTNDMTDKAADVVDIATGSWMGSVLRTSSNEDNKTEMTFRCM